MMNWKTRVTVIGGFLGLLIGVASAMLYIRTVQGEQGDREEVTLPEVKTKDLLPILVTAVGLVRTIANLGTLNDQ
ncbi:MAG: hypothetical protein M1546_02140 [Chloroflexi bacterium]|nr:hypothetical protein [Chloroflexota bacterium]